MFYLRNRTFMLCSVSVPPSPLLRQSPTSFAAPLISTPVSPPSIRSAKMDAAASMIEKAIVANPTYAEAFNNLGLFLSLSLASNIIVVVLVQSYGVLYRDAGSISLAIEAYEQCLKKDPDSRNAGQCISSHVFLQKEIVDRSCGNNSLHIETRSIEDNLVFCSFVHIHSQFSTKTFPGWDRAQTMRVIAYKRSVKYEP
ncbi:hypothetical protein L6452_22084 [Arctium lappa]|uniref:Uncharacterized protein n=1 Tax=Arctium lappa TaxID=4217 RepID=A0ACB9AYU9_ARCLA|nr:hypothetical protein L6452_22084 [Arctium lappa]